MSHGAPDIYIADHLAQWGVQAEINGKWVLARPLGYQGWFLRRRLRLAWGVFTGRYDALRWIGDEPPLFDERNAK